MRRTRNKIVVLLLLVVLWSVACATFKQNTYNVLYSAGVAYDMTMSVAGSLYRSGKVTETQKTEIIKYANGFYSAYHAAVDAFEVYNKTSAAADKDKALVALNAIIPKLSDLKDYLARLKITQFNDAIDRLNELNNLIKGL